MHVRVPFDLESIRSCLQVFCPKRGQQPRGARHKKQARPALKSYKNCGFFPFEAVHMGEKHKEEGIPTHSNDGNAEKLSGTCPNLYYKI